MIDLSYAFDRLADIAVAAEKIAASLESIDKRLQERNELLNICEGAQAEALVDILDLLRAKIDPIKAVCYPDNPLDKSLRDVSLDCMAFTKNISCRTYGLLDRAFKEFNLKSLRDLIVYGRRKFACVRGVGHKALHEVDLLMRELNVEDLWLRS